MVRPPSRFVEGQGLAAVLVLVVALVNLRLPDELSAGPRWLLPVVELLLLVVLLVADWSDGERSTWSRPVALLLVGVLVVDGLMLTWLLLVSLVSTAPADAVTLLSTSAQVLMTNLVAFALLYWQWDRGGPGRRSAGATDRADFLFPQMTDADWAPEGWTPRLGDYLYTSFTAVVAFSPTDTMPLTHRAKLAMGVQAVVAVSVIVVTISRAINVLP